MSPACVTHARPPGLRTGSGAAKELPGGLAAGLLGSASRAATPLEWPANRMCIRRAGDNVITVAGQTASCRRPSWPGPSGLAAWGRSVRQWAGRGSVCGTVSPVHLCEGKTGQAGEPPAEAHTAGGLVCGTRQQPALTMIHLDGPREKQGPCCAGFAAARTSAAARTQPEPKVALRADSGRRGQTVVGERPGRRDSWARRAPSGLAMARDVQLEIRSRRLTSASRQLAPSGRSAPRKQLARTSWPAGQPWR